MLLIWGPGPRAGLCSALCDSGQGDRARLPGGHTGPVCVCVCYVVCVFLCVWCIYVCVIRVCSVCVCKTGIKGEACASEQQGASAQVPLPSAHHFLDVPGAWVSLGTASSGLSAPVPLGPRLTCGFWRGRGWRGCVPCRAAASPGLRLAGGCQVPCQRPGLCQLLSLPPPVCFLTLGPQRLWAGWSSCPQPAQACSGLAVLGTQWGE